MSTLQTDPPKLVEARADLVRKGLVDEMKKAVEGLELAEEACDDARANYWRDREAFVGGLLARHDERRAGANLEQEERERVARETETETTTARLLAQAGRTGDEVVFYEWVDGFEDDGETTLRDAVSANLEDDYVVGLLLALEVGGEYEIGGGAAPLLIVRRIS